MALLGDEDQVEACFSPFGQILLILTQDRCTVCAEHTIGSEIILDTRWNSYVMWLCGISFSGCLETVFVSVQDRGSVCAKRTIGSKIVLDTPNGTPR
jgi:hypothetical protein